MHKFARITAFIAFLFLFSNAYAQDNIDSLKIAFKNSKQDTLRVKTVYRLLVNLPPDEKEFDYYLGQIKVLADKNLAKESTSEKGKLFWKKALGKYYVNKSEITFYTNNDAAMQLLDKGIQIFSEVKDISQMADAIVGKGIFLRRMGRTPEAVECYYKGLKYFEQIKDKDGIAYAQMSIAAVYKDQKKDAEAIALNKKALAYFESIKKPTMEDIGTQAELNHTIGHGYFNNQKYDIAEQYFNKAMTQAKQIGYTSLMSTVLDKIGRIHYQRGENDIAYQKYQEALNLPQPELYKANLYISIGELCIAEKKYAEAESYLTQANTIGKKLNDLNMQMYAVRYLNALYKDTKNYEKALSMFELYKTFQDSIKVSDSRNTLKEQQLKYDFEKKELNSKLLNQKETAVKNNWLIGLSAILLLVLLGGYFYYRNNKQKQAITVLEKEQIKQKLLVTQMNPHFIFNSIDNIQGLIHSNKDEEAVNYLTKFSKLTRQILENSNENYISLEEEVEMTKNYLSIQQLLYDNKFSFNITIEKEINQEAIFLPPMLTQPFIENAIKHGLSNTSENGKINIHFYLRESKLFFEVTDNGKGFDAAQKSTSHKSLAMTITKERLVSYTKNQDFVVQADNIKDNNENVVGAKVSFEIPYIYEN
ncbi:tetratricopeptide repeat-containing sensor histidine kinase [Flavobacterium sangjuense]|nr:histidine kinase [Flavobacterium sangjuense]